MELNLSSCRKAALIFLLCYLSDTSLAQRVSPDTLDIDQLYLYKHKAVNMRNSGIILTIAGAGILTATIIGNISYKNIVWESYVENENSDRWENMIIAGFVTGGSATAAGIPLWAVGGRRNARMEIALKKFNTIQEYETALGLRITVRF